MKIWWNCAHSHAIPDVDELVSSSDLEKCVTASVSQQWMWMGAVRMRVQTADKNITPVHQLTSWEEKSYVFVRNPLEWGEILVYSDSHSDGTHSLQSMYCWDTDAMLKKETNSTTWMSWERVHFHLILISGWIIPFLQCISVHGFDSVNTSFLSPTYIFLHINAC